MKIDRLREFAAKVTTVTGIPIEVNPSDFRIGGVLQRGGFYDVRVPSSIIGPLEYEAAWIYLLGISDGYHASRTQETK